MATCFAGFQCLCLSCHGTAMMTAPGEGDAGYSGATVAVRKFYMYILMV